jgi:hypothetical protein
MPHKFFGLNAVMRTDEHVQTGPASQIILGTAMTRRQLSYAALVIAVFTTPAIGDEQPKDSAATPRQVAHCMMKRLREAPSESYRDAFKICREQFDSARRDPPNDTAIKKTTTVQPESP